MSGVKEPFSIDHVMGASEQMNTLAFDCHVLVHSTDPYV